MIQPKWDQLSESTQRAVNAPSQSQLQEAYKAGYYRALNEATPSPDGRTYRPATGGGWHIYDENGEYLGITKTLRHPWSGYDRGYMTIPPGSAWHQDGPVPGAPKTAEDMGFGYTRPSGPIGIGGGGMGMPGGMPI
jgi:hypothetical protein